eukprot:CAMPEP_0173205762 /NCGR_PEP_ID=MMETSP1141-20130122/20942_1 /TAXON_ID=483371 /ORGANISM="non described non described, Strain CCMP2298" /LENGTH=125 /DNA_ID=CAMNT_0014131741 /DNA_START=142 /DNA_END=519 /DNA_ORIENTATION=+
MLYVGGLEESVSEEMVHAAFVPFGELKSIQIPKDYQQNKARGFAFVEYDLDEDAADAIENMDGSELLGRVLRCNLAKEAPKLAPGKAIWSAEEWLQKQDGGGDADEVVEAANLEPTAAAPTEGGE